MAEYAETLKQIPFIPAHIMDIYRFYEGKRMAFYKRDEVLKILSLDLDLVGSKFDFDVAEDLPMLDGVYPFGSIYEVSTSQYANHNIIDVVNLGHSVAHSAGFWRLLIIDSHEKIYSFADGELIRHGNRLKDYIDKFLSNTEDYLKDASARIHVEW